MPTVTKKKTPAKVAAAPKTKAAPKKNAEIKKSDEFAVIETGGKQYTVSVGKVIKIEKIIGKQKAGDAIIFNKVLLVDNGKDTSIGDPYIKGASVGGEIQKVGRTKKVEVVKYRAKSNYFKRRGHRQPYFEVRVTKIV